MTNTRLRLALLILVCLSIEAQAQPWFWPSYSLFRSPVCDRIRNELLCARAIEGAQILAHTDAFSRRGDTLSVHLQTGVRVFTDKVWARASGFMPRSSMRVSFLGVIPSVNAVLVHQIEEEQRQLLWIDRATGVEHDIPEIPLLSPSSKRFALLSDYTLRGNDIQIRDSKDMTVEFELRTHEHRFPDGHWISDDVFRFMRTATANNPEFPTIWEQMELAKTDTGWALDFARSN